MPRQPLFSCLAPVVLVALPWLAPAARADAPRPAVAEALDVRYHDGDGRQTLDVFAPKDAKNAPVVVFVHGGAWMFGDKNFFGIYRRVGQELAARGYVAVLVNYRLSPGVKHPGHVKDVARAYAWTCKNIAKHGGDPERIALMGHSAGGHLVALLAADGRYLNDEELKLTDKERAALKGVVAVSGVYRVPSRDEFDKMAGEMIGGLFAMRDKTEGVPMVPWLMRTSKAANPFPLVFGTDPKVWQQASPVNHVRKGLPPFLVLYAEAELAQLPAMAKEFAKALEGAGNDVRLERIDGCHHNTILMRLHRPDDPTAAAVLPFLDKVFAAKAAPQP